MVDSPSRLMLHMMKQYTLSLHYDDLGPELGHFIRDLHVGAFSLSTWYFHGQAPRLFKILQTILKLLLLSANFANFISGQSNIRMLRTKL